MQALRLIGFVLGAITFAAASASLALFGAASVVGGRPVLAGALGSIVALGIACPPLVRRFSERARLSAISAQELLRWYADAIREQLVAADVGITTSDVGVHVYLKRRRSLLPWRNEYVRYARSAITSRSPEPTHAIWSEHWRSGHADGLVGIAAERRERLQVDLMDAEHEYATDAIWNRWYESRDARSLGVDWVRAAKPRDWFSTIWAEAIPDSRGSVVGVITLNIEKECADGYAKLLAANASGLLQSAARATGLALTAAMR